MREHPPVAVRGVFSGLGTTRSLDTGEILFRAGDSGNEMYGVISGTMELRRGDRVVQSVGPGGTFGELAIIDSSERTLTAVTVEPSEIAVIGRRDFLFLVGETPMFAIDVMRSMATLIRDLAVET